MTENTTTKRPRVNVEVLDAALAEIERVDKLQEQDEDYDGPRWNQSVWRCGTSMCLAGWVAELNDARWLTTPTGQLAVPDAQPAVEEAWGHLRRPTLPAELIYDPDFPQDAKQYNVGTPFVQVSDWAQHRLALDPEDASQMFASSNDLDDLREMRDRLARGEELWD